MNLKFTDFGNEGASSLSKGETPEDTLYNVAAMKPDLMVVRYGSQPSIHRALQKISVPIISGGGGATEHPTQALLDAFTIEEKHGSLKGQKILFVGDVLHSRVAHSGIKLFSRMGAEVATACPESLMRSDALVREHKHFIKLDEAIKWADVVMGLRIQKERHSDMTEDFSEYYLSASVLSSLKKDGLIMHPGPFIPGHDMDREVLADSRCVIHRQVENGVYVRMALMAQILGVNL
jgi:aspartate carbamoyltransferase catalytic subunit